MNERSKRIPTPTAQRILQADPEPHEPAISRIRQRDTSFCESQGLLEKTFVEWIAAHDAIKGHDGGWCQLARDSHKITVDQLC